MSTIQLPSSATPAPPSAQPHSAHLQLGGLYCAACASVIEQALMAEPGVLEAEVNYAASRARVRWEAESPVPHGLIRAIERAGYSAVPDLAEPARALRQREERAALWRLFVASFCMMQVMMYASPAYFAEPGSISAEMLKLLQWASWLLSIPVLVFSSSPMFKEAWAGLLRGKITMDLPVVIGIVVTFVVSSGATFSPGGIFGHEVYYDSLTMFVSFLLGARWLTLKAQHRVTAALEAASARLTPEARRIEADGRMSLVPPEQLLAGDLVRVHAGEAFCADGRVIEGRTQVDEALLTGESRPVDKRLGDEVLCGSLNLGSPVTMEVQRLGNQTRFEAVIALMRTALTQRPAMLRAADRVAVPFLWTVLALALVAGIAWYQFEPAKAVWVAVAVLIVTCPCALSLAAPSALLAAAGKLARHGVLVQRIDAFEALAKLDTLYFDKTGTLTEDKLKLVGTRLAPAAIEAGMTEAQALQLAASLARSSSHPLSQALAREAATSEAIWTDITEVAGHGLEAKAWDGSSVRLGSWAWVAPGQMPPPGEESARVWFADATGALASFEFGEFIKADAPAAVQVLKASGLDMALLSGDEDSRVQAVAQSLGIEKAHGAKTPEAKLEAILSAQQAGHVVGMMGDGINDAPVIAQADVSFACAQGSSITQSSADFIVLSGRVSDVVLARDVARRAMQVVRQNLAWAAAYNAVCIPLALAGWFPPWAAGIGMAASSVFVILNALRLGADSKVA